MLRRLLAAPAVIVALALAYGFALSAGAAGAAPLAHAARGCPVGSGQGYGYSYLTSLNVTRTTCTVGRTVARHHGHVRGWRCRTRRLDTSPVQYDDSVGCTSGRRLVRWTFTQNT